MEEVIDGARRAGAHEFILGLSNGYDTIVGERGYTLSGGQRQRVAIARTIVENPAILILDDATSAIDVKIEMQIHDALREVMSGRTTLIIAHRLSTISLAQRVVLLEGGRVIADGTHLELMATEPRYAQRAGAPGRGRRGKGRTRRARRPTPTTSSRPTMGRSPTRPTRPSSRAPLAYSRPIRSTSATEPTSSPAA